MDIMGSKMSANTNVDADNGDLDWTKSGYTANNSVDRRAAYESQTVIGESRHSPALEQLRVSVLNRQNMGANIDASRITGMTNFDPRGLGGMTVATNYREFRNHRRQLSRESWTDNHGKDQGKQAEDTVGKYSCMAISKIDNRNDAEARDQKTVTGSRLQNEGMVHTEEKKVEGGAGRTPPEKNIETPQASIDPVLKILSCIWEVVGIQANEDEKKFLSEVVMTDAFLPDLKWYMESIKKMKVVLSRIRIPPTLPAEHIPEWNKVSDKIKMAFMRKNAAFNMPYDNFEKKEIVSKENPVHKPITALNLEDTFKQSEIAQVKQDNSRMILDSFIELDILLKPLNLAHAPLKFTDTSIDQSYLPTPGFPSVTSHHQMPTLNNLSGAEVSRDARTGHFDFAGASNAGRYANYSFADRPS